MSSLPSLTEETVLQLAAQALADRQIAYDTTTGLQARYEGTSTGLLGFEGQPIRHWTVSFLTNPGFFDQEMFFIKLDDTTRKVLYILGPREFIL
ncbi:hypothetical protein [Hymenobacter psychrotolerans]|uniref:Uncharacterized protein n=1 Tax=Hymenobacter psychrotolerans DSM 18569 TaxID=1121959 RepID=A0A1M7DYK1_9BACT|nr:hypothetical protein [Hymenobacter psychrotolerans]SHL84574.1 hypothetical protein SAMN02746009_03482 [Hymenobacter psychrotolerans DSM 18569]